MENTLAKVAATGQVKISLRELNLKRGGNNVRWLNDREDKLLQTSLNSMEKVHKATLSRLQHEVKGLQNTLREQATVRSPQLTKVAHLPENDHSDTRRTTTSVHDGTFNLRREHLSAPNETDDEIRNLVVEEFEDVEHICFEDAKNLSQKTQKGLAANSSHTQGACTREVSSALKRPITKQLSSSSEQSSSSSSTLSVPRRKISVTDPPPTGELSVSPGSRKTLSQSSLHLSTNHNSYRSKAMSSEMLIPASTHHSVAGTLNASSSPPLRKVSPESTRHLASPLFFRRKFSHNNSSRKPKSPRPARKISCPTQLQHLPRVHQEEVRPLQPPRDNSGSASRLAVDIPTELPKLHVSRGIDQGPSFHGNVSPLGSHVDVMDCTLQEKVNNFLRSLENDEKDQENEGQSSS